MRVFLRLRLNLTDSRSNRKHRRHSRTLPTLGNWSSNNSECSGNKCLSYSAKARWSITKSPFEKWRTQRRPSSRKFCSANAASKAPESTCAFSSAKCPSSGPMNKCSNTSNDMVLSLRHALYVTSRMDRIVAALSSKYRTSTRPR